MHGATRVQARPYAAHIRIDVEFRRRNAAGFRRVHQPHGFDDRRQWGWRIKSAGVYGDIHHQHWVDGP